MIFDAPPGADVATGTAVLTLGTVSSVTITNAGSGYTSTPIVTFSGGGCTPVTSYDVVMQSGVAEVAIGNAGSGYTSAPTVAFSGGGGTGADATAVLQSGVSSVELNLGSGGTGCLSAFAASFSAPGGAIGVARLAEGGYDQYQNLYWARRTLDGKQLQVQVVE